MRVVVIIGASFIFAAPAFAQKEERISIADKAAIEIVYGSDEERRQAIHNISPYGAGRDEWGQRALALVELGASDKAEDISLVLRLIPRLMDELEGERKVEAYTILISLHSLCPPRELYPKFWVEQIKPDLESRLEAARARDSAEWEQEREKLLLEIAKKSATVWLPEE